MVFTDAAARENCRIQDQVMIDPPCPGFSAATTLDNRIFWEPPLAWRVPLDDLGRIPKLDGYVLLSPEHP
jgi:hypothetical protein